MSMEACVKEQPFERRKIKHSWLGECKKMTLKKKITKGRFHLL